MATRLSSKTSGIIPDYLVEHRDEFDALFTEYLAVLGPKSLNQIRRALDRPANRFWTEYLHPHLLRDSSYVPLSPYKRLPGRNHLHTTEVAQHGASSGQASATYFANLLGYGKQDSEGRWTSPSDRIAFGPFVVFTIEYDYDDKSLTSEALRDARVEFLKTQLGWCRIRSGGKDALDSAFGDLYRAFRTNTDFAGLVVNYGGHKSLHIHVVFRLDELRARFTFNSGETRTGYQSHWDLIARLVDSILVPGVMADCTLRQPEQWRRLPNGLWLNDKPDHILGIPLDTLVPQLTLWEKFADRAQKGANTPFLSPSLFVTTVPSRREHQTVARQLTGNMPASVRDFCIASLKKLIEQQTQGQYPKLDALIYEGGEWKALLWASDDDRNANCVIGEEYRRILQRGQHELASDVELPMPLGALLQLWRDRFQAQESHYDQITDSVPEASDFHDGISAINISPQPEARIERFEERLFREHATSRDDVPTILSELSEHLIGAHRNVLMVAPEGTGKTRGIMAKHPVLMESINADINRCREQNGEKPEWIVYSMFAFASYDLAEQKAREYEILHPNGPYVPIVLRSVSREYGECCAEIGVARLPYDDPDISYAGESFIDRIKREQPKVHRMMQERHAAFWAAPVQAAKSPVFFSVHHVMQRWTTESLTRVYWHPRFFDDAPGERWELKNDMRLRLAIHDEIGRKDLLWSDRAEIVEWVKDNLGSSPDWRGASRAAKRRMFDELAARTRIQSEIGGYPIDQSFDDCLQIDDLDYSKEDHIEITEVESYDHSDDPERALYRKRHGARWYAKAKTWWDGLADRVVITTTEALPTMMVEAINPRLKPRNRFEIFRFECPQISRDRVSVLLRREATSKNVVRAIQKLRLELGSDIQVITNSAKALDGTITHMSARGSNDWAHPRLAQVLLHVGPDEYEELCLVNQVFGLCNAIRLAHVDQLNQACGRNMAFRNPGGHQHFVIVSPVLWEKIKDDMLRLRRYDIDLHSDAAQRYRYRRIRNGEMSSNAHWDDERLAA